MSPFAFEAHRLFGGTRGNFGGHTGFGGNLPTANFFFSILKKILCSVTKVVRHVEIVSNAALALGASTPRP